MLTIPLTSDPKQTMTVVLGSTTVDLAVRYNDQSGVWNFDLALDGVGTVLLTNVPMLIGQDLLAPYALGLGGLIVTDTSGQYLDAGPDDLGTRVTLQWLSPTELAGLKSAGAAL
jgi:hypothetical protein